MAIKTYSWITLWFLISTLVVFWDAGYLFLRPRSMKGGDLHWIFEPYGLYQEIDHACEFRLVHDVAPDRQLGLRSTFIFEWRRFPKCSISAEYHRKFAESYICLPCPYF
ncbi:hypothetical protein AX14_005753 [Amanita brunnescens Koide BX004]|nr:hypothetical protein AX14_005753 [Amanita brunnescens Koide BX004]